MIGYHSTGVNRVCKVMYLNTFGLTKQCLAAAFKNNAKRKSSTSTADMRKAHFKKSH